MDFDAFYQSGLDLLVGQYTGLYPLAANAAFALLALMPKDAAYWTVIVVSVACYVGVLGRRSFVWLLYVPFWQVLFAGQIDMAMLWLVHQASPVALALITLKPQLCIFALPALIAHPEKVRPTLLWILALHLPMFAVRPIWFVEWIGRLWAEGRWGDPLTCSLWAIPALAIVAVVATVLWPRDKFYVLSLSLNPLLRYYDTIMVAGMSLSIIPVSWLALAMVAKLNSWWPMSLIGVALWIMLGWAEHGNARVD